MNKPLQNKFIFPAGLLLSLVLLVSGCGGGGGGSGEDSSVTAESTFDTQTTQSLESAVQKNLDAFGASTSVPGAVVGVWTSKGHFVKGIGQSDLTSKDPMNIDLHFRVASITKSFIVTVILQLVDEGKLSLNDTVSKFGLDVSVPAANQITIRQLCNMTSGLFDIYHSPQIDSLHLTPNTHLTPERVIQIATSSPSVFAPGAGWYYSNTNYFVLGLIIEKVTGNRLNDEVQNRLISPLGLTNTSFPIEDPTMPAPYAHGYEPDSHNHWNDESVFSPPSYYWGAGAMISNLSDLKVWIKAAITGSTNSAATQTERLTCVQSTDGNEKFGLGIVCTGGWYGYTGGIPGYNAAAYYLPGADATIVVLVNSLRPNPYPGVASAIVRDIAQTVTPDNVPFL